jgi:PAS domain S-box-containing protein
LSSAETAVQPAEVLVHELLVHKVELEMQIEELRAAHQAMEESRDRYADLYDLAVVGHIGIDADGLIGEINLTGAAMLAVERSKLVRCPFAKYVSPPDADRWHRFLVDMLTQGDDQPQALLLELRRGDGSTFPAYLDCRRRHSGGTETSAKMPVSLRLTVIDVDKIRQAETEMRSATTPATDIW